ncbi:uncharacterized protein LOC125200517 [Salvia hispanica]|uniref:uncharacterized protein LOC125200517 n=1 Tax=Salvia hispanica TaxID=49212 RepID=UPI0020097197|nr:uncharacterized protein LOC125200517 [Salvia hispanica]
MAEARLRAAFAVLGCVTTATITYTVVTHGFHKEIYSPWFTSSLIDFYINTIAIGMWIIYKESSWISSLIWMLLLIWFGSIATCLYVVLQLSKLTPHESHSDPIHFVLLKSPSTEEVESNKSILSVVGARFLFLGLGCLMLATLVCTIAIGGSPFHQEIYTPWMCAILVDFYVNVVPSSVWVVYKESSWTRSALWIIMLICFGSAGTSAYVALQLFRMSPQDPVHLVLLNEDSRQVHEYRIFRVLLGFISLLAVNDGYEGTLHKDKLVC